MSLDNYSETNQFQNKNNNTSERYTGLSIYNNKRRVIHQYVKVVQIGNISTLNRFISKDLQIVVRKKDPNIASGSVEGNLFDLDVVNEDSIFKYYVKSIGLWRIFDKTVAGPFTFDELKKNYFIYIHKGQLDNITQGNFKSFQISPDETLGINGGPGIIIGGKTRRRRSVKKASRKSRRHRKR
jgi:hypothetical protein